MSERPIIDLQKSLGSQSNIWEAFRAYKSIGKKNHNSYYSIIFALFLAILFLLPLFISTPNETSLSYKALGSLADILFSYSVGITGFLIAGVAILVSINDKELFIIMAKTPYQNKDKSYSKYSQFQFMFFSLIISLVYHLSLLAFAVFVKFFTSGGAFLIVAMSSIVPVHETVQYSINATLVVFLAWLFVRCLLLVKSSIWNVYQMVVLTVLWANHQTTQNTNQPK